jgi:hypothetical protein
MKFCYLSLLVLPAFLLIDTESYGQSQPLIENKAVTEIFTDFHINLNDSSKTTGFGLNRAYLGYTYKADEHFSAALTLNIGSPDDVLPGTVRRRYAYFREASICWSDENLSLYFGLTDTRLFRFQQRFWGKRYLANTYQSLNGYGYVADLGISADYKFNDLISADLTVMNGEGYLELQLDNGVRSSLGLIITPGDNLAFRIYGDYEKRNGVDLFTTIAFAGFKNQNLNAGLEFSSKTNLDGIESHMGWGISGTGGVNVTKNNELFVRYDYSTSVIPDGETEHWNYLKDGTFMIFGLQHTFTPNIKIALNFQGRNPYADSEPQSNLVYINALFRF